MLRNRALAIVCLLTVSLIATPAASDVFWVDANSGNDLNPGTDLLPFATITYAIANAGDGATIRVLPGVYDAGNGETFPIQLAADQSLIGDPANQGAGVTPTKIVGRGAYAGLSGIGSIATVICGPGSLVSGFQIDADAYELLHSGLVIDEVEAEVSDNQVLGAAYCGVYLKEAGASLVANNALHSSSYGVYVSTCPDMPVITGNVFVSPALSVDVTGATTNAQIFGNTFQAGSRVSVQVQHGTPRIESNTFEAGAGFVYGGIFTQREVGNPVVRSNTFLNAMAIQVRGDAHPDLGLDGDPGQNDFSGVTDVCVRHEGSADISAIGNTWPVSPPRDGVDIVITGTGSIILFGVPVDASSVGRLKAKF